MVFACGAEMGDQMDDEDIMSSVGEDILRAPTEEINSRCRFEFFPNVSWPICGSISHIGSKCF